MLAPSWAGLAHASPGTVLLEGPDAWRAVRYRLACAYVHPAERLPLRCPAGEDLQGDERERALRAGAVVAARRLCEAYAAATTAAAATAGEDGGDAAAHAASIQPWQLSMYLLQQEEQQQRLRQEGDTAAAAEGPKRHVALGTVAY